MPEFVTEQLGRGEQDAVPFGLRGLCDLRGRIDTGLMGQSDIGLMGQSDIGLMGQSENGQSGQSDSFSFWPQTHSEKSDVVQSISNCESSNEDYWTPLLAKIRSGANGKPSIRIAGLVQGVPATILIDCGAERDCVSERFLKCNSIKYVKNLPELSVRVADGRINKCGLLSTAQLQLGSYRDCGDFAVTKLEGEDLILGMPWLARIDPLILWKKRTLRFVHAGQEHIITETDTQQKRMCHVISAVQFVRQIKKKNPAWICVIKPSDVDKSTK